MANTFEEPHSPDPDRASLRRREERVATRVTALVHCHGRYQTVRIIDFSLGGLQVQGGFGVGVGDMVVVELLSAHRLEGKVAWSMGSRLGVRFAQPLEAGHPALAVLEKPAHHALGATDQVTKPRSLDE